MRLTIAGLQHPGHPGDVEANLAAVAEAAREARSRGADVLVTPEMFVTGYNIGAPEVENALLAHPAVAECAVIGVPCPERGQKVKAFILLADFAEPSADLTEKLQSFVKDQIAPYKYPREIEFVDALPKTATS